MCLFWSWPTGRGWSVTPNIETRCLGLCSNGNPGFLLISQLLWTTDSSPSTCTAENKPSAYVNRTSHSLSDSPCLSTFTLVFSKICLEINWMPALNWLTGSVAQICPAMASVPQGLPRLFADLFIQLKYIYQCIFSFQWQTLRKHLCIIEVFLYSR